MMCYNFNSKIYFFVVTLMSIYLYLDCETSPIGIELYTRIEQYYLNVCSEYYEKTMGLLTPVDIQSNDFFKNLDSNLFSK